MNTQPLFLDQPLQFDQAKLAGMLTRLNDNVDMWPKQIMEEAYKQIPYLSHFMTDIVLDKVDEEKGYAFGSIVVSPRTEMGVEERVEAELSKGHIPIIVKEQQLYPLDVLLVGRHYMPLTEQRIRESLFRHDTFDAPRDRPPDYSLVNELYPPLRATEGGFGGSGVKLGSAIPLLPQLHGTIRPDHKERFLKEATADSVLAAYANADEGVQAAYESAINLKLANYEKTAEFNWRQIKPNVVQLQKLANGNVMVKWANTDMFAPNQEEVPPSVAEEMLGDQDLVAQMENDGTVTMSPEAAVKETLDLDEIRTVDQFGLWTVQDTVGANLTGWAFPNLMTLDMQVMPLVLFTNGSQYALQENVAGKIVGKSTDIPKGVPNGYGVLYYVDHGNAKAFIPMTITTSYRGPDGRQVYMGQCDMGDPVSFSFEEGLRMPARLGDSEWALPNTFCWLPLKSKTELVAEPALFMKTANRRWTETVEIVGDGDVFSFRGPAVAKLAEAQVKFMDRPQAEFLGVSLGIDPLFLKDSLTKAASGQLVTIKNLRHLTPAHEKLAGARAQISAAFSQLDHPIRNYLLVKEASVLDDAMTADKVLGLGFINAENISTFVDMLPQLDECSSKLSELLVAVRLGLRDVPEAAVERMLVALEDVIKGLKALQQKEMPLA